MTQADVRLVDVLFDQVDARLVCAAVPRREVVSGWDLFGWKPKEARRAAPAGSVYWFEGLNGDPGKLAGWASAGESTCRPASSRASSA